MFSRRKFLTRSTISSLGVALGVLTPSCVNSKIEGNSHTSFSQNSGFPLVISTWKNQESNAAAMSVIEKNGSAVDAVEAGVRIPEANKKDSSVGYGGRPDRDGNVTLDACIMDSKGNAGSVCFLQHIKHPVSVAKKVMNDTPHVILAGKGALKFALENGFKKENLLTKASKRAWEEWQKESNYKPIINIENHDTIGMLAIDKNGDIAGACTTSGLAYKLQGRVGDSPIIGAGLYIDNEVGGATATGLGEAVLKTLGSFLVVELMRQGMSPGEACKEAIMRISRKQKYSEFQVGYIAVNKKGEYGAYAIQPGFSFVVDQNNESKLMKSDSFIEKEK
jgi:N4-(beta-N-acetylglucosaminyl)-L-asparaginase